MNWHKWIRQAHRWLSALFTVIVIAEFFLVNSGDEVAQWLYYVPLLPLFLLLLSGLYLFVLPYFARRRGAVAG